MTEEMQSADEICEYEEPEVDSRVKGELDSLNRATDDINRLENEISDERAKFKSLLHDATQQLAILGNKYGKSIDRARPYFDALKELKQAQAALQRAVHNFHKSNGVHRAAKETISLAELRLSEFGDQKVDAAWQDVLNLQTIKFNEAEADRTRSERIHAQATKRYEYLNKKCKKIKSKHKVSTAKTKSYFESKEKLELKLQKQRRRVDNLREEIDSAKSQYKAALANLETISTEIHEKRQDHARVMSLLKEREAGEGSENPTYDVTDASHSQFDLIGPKTYDDISELEEDLDRFSFEDHSDDDISYSSSDEGSIGSGTTSLPTSPKMKRPSLSRKSSYKRQMSSPALGGSSSGCQINSSSKPRRKLTPPDLKDCLLEEDEGIPNEMTDSSDTKSNRPRLRLNITGDDSIPVDNDISRRDSTYITLHGVSKPATDAITNGKCQDSDSYDIFDDLCA